MINYLPKPKSYLAAHQCREMGLVVGDKIIGRETHADGTWNENHLRVDYIGVDHAVFLVYRRNNAFPEWQYDGESCYITLNGRQWYRAPEQVTPPPSRQLGQ
jgi:hypothetical protein